MWCVLPIKYYSQLGGARKQPKHHQKATALITHIPLSKTNRHTDKQAKKQASQQTNQMVFLPASQFPSPPNQKQHIPYLNGLWPGRFIGRETVEIRGPSGSTWWKDVSGISPRNRFLQISLVLPKRKQNGNKWNHTDIEGYEKLDANVW